jgi:hypothetical protein
VRTTIHKGEGNNMATYQELAAHARAAKEEKVKAWVDRYGVILSKILYDDTISVVKKVALLEEYHIPMPISPSYRWSRASVYKWMRNLEAYL